MRRLLALALLPFAVALLVTSAGCASGPPRVGEAGPQVTDGAAEEQYQKTLQAYSDHAELYGTFETHLFAAATFQSVPFREARARRLAAFQAQPPEVLEKKLEQERSEAAQVNVFFLGAELTDYHFDDFDRKDSVWRLALVTDAGEVTPLLVERVGRADVNMRAYYPYMSDFWTAYRVRFPKTFPNGEPVIRSDTQRLTFRLSSTLGKAEFHVQAQ